MRSKFYILLLVLVPGIFSCSDIFENDISKKTLNVYGPGDSVTALNYTVTFYWDKLDDALTYNLQVVSPDFARLSTFALDTNVKVNKLTYQLPPGQYQWRLRALNGSSSSPYVIRTLYVDSAALKDQRPLLSSPAANFYTKAGTITFDWVDLYGASNYVLQIDSIASSGERIRKQTLSVTNSLKSATMKSEGYYVWRVVGKKGADSSQYSADRYFKYDKTVPVAVVLNAPAEGAFVPKNTAFKWDPSSADAYKYNFYVFTDKDISKALSGYPKTVFSTADLSYTYNENLTSGRTLYWGVIAIDSAGNESKLINTDLRKFVTQ